MKMKEKFYNLGPLTQTGRSGYVEGEKREARNKFSTITTILRQCVQFTGRIKDCQKSSQPTSD